MFALFYDNTLKDFWGNSPGDVFIDATCRGLKLDPSKVELVFYPFVNNPPEFYEFSPSKSLIVKKKVITQEEVEVEVDGQMQTQVINHESFEVESEHAGEVYFSAGVMVKPC